MQDIKEFDKQKKDSNKSAYLKKVIDERNSRVDKSVEYYKKSLQELEGRYFKRH
jgi:hypothetical protein